MSYRDEDKTVRVHPETYGLIDDNLVGPNKSHTSVSRFTTASVEKHSPEILSLVSGANIFRKLVRQLSKIDGLEEDEPEVQIDARWGPEKLTSSISFEITERTQGIVSGIGRNLNTNESLIFRACIFRELFELAQKSNHPFQYDWRVDEIQHRWARVETGLISPQTQFIEILVRRFHMSIETTPELIRGNEERFTHFAEMYKKEFYESDAYDQIIETGSEKLLTNVENVIEEHTEVSFGLFNPRDIQDRS